MPTKRLLIAVGLAVVVALVAAGCGSSGPSSSAAGASAGASATSGNAVSISGFAFSPATITVQPGTTVTWTNQESVGHDVVADDGSWGSDTLANGQTYSHTFDAAGTYAYHCGIHPSMKGTVIVAP